MVVSEFEPDDVLNDLNRKFASVSLEQSKAESVYKEVLFEELFEHKQNLSTSNNYLTCYHAIKNIRRYLTQSISLERIQHVFDLELEDQFIKILESTGYDDVKYETAWTITNLAYGTRRHTARIVESGVIDALVHCFRNTENYRVKSQCAWAFANVSIESPTYRELMAQEGLIGDIAAALNFKCDTIYANLNGTLNLQDVKHTAGDVILDDKADLDDVRDLTWSLANVCRGGFKTVEHWQQYRTAFDALSQCINFHHDDIWTEACWGLSRVLSNMYNYEPFFCTVNLNPKLCPRLIELLRTDSLELILPVLQTISNFSSGPNDYIEILLNADLLNYIWWYMSPDIPAPLRRNALLTISNLAAGNELTVRRVVYNESIMESVISHIKIPGHEYITEENKWISSAAALIPETREEWTILKESLWVLSNITTLGNNDCICALLRNYNTLIQSLTSLLHFSRLSSSVCLKVVDCLLKITDRTNQIAELTPPVSPHPRNPYAEEMLRSGVVECLSYLNGEINSAELAMQSEMLIVTLKNSSPQSSLMDAGLVSAFGLSNTGHLSTPHVRRIVRGYEDGDVRFIEQAIHSMEL
ncbi:armadillo-type protein [Mycotypha africana]|uniref:armadillo-type protein n=1 Tax=Mycotypha africana TaxID=64632 RepID=UPI0022FFCA5D|nr:armadillo-type protein [Mycotypha africana]KAI8971650.1 armadillo-type protein [Mycotypha africana]